MCPLSMLELWFADLKGLLTRTTDSPIPLELLIMTRGPKDTHVVRKPIFGPRHEEILSLGVCEQHRRRPACASA